MITAKQFTYRSTKLTIKGNTWILMQSFRNGEHNGYSVVKTTNNPWRGPGKDFRTQDELLAHYKSPAFQAAFIQGFDILEEITAE